jgi:hypothetical protein
MRFTFGAAPRALAVEPIADRAAWQFKVATDITEGNAGTPKLKGALPQVSGMHARIFQRGYDTFGCAGDGSRTRMPFQANDFESFV